MKVLLLLVAIPALVAAQRPQPEFRLDALGPAPFALHAGGGVTVSLGNYARVAVIGSRAVVQPAGNGRAAWRGDLFARLALDPFRRHRVGFSLGGGLTVHERPYLLAVAELEGPRWGGLSPAVQAALGGGPRLGVILRRGFSDRR